MDKVQKLKSAGLCPSDLSDEQIEYFLEFAEKRGLDPFQKQVYCLSKRDSKSNKSNLSIITSIDGFRAIANRTNELAGISDYTFNGSKTQYEVISETAEGKRPIPRTATCTVFKLKNGVSFETTATAEMSAYMPKTTYKGLWETMPFLMLGKCAEALALRKAFPEALGELYTSEEMEQPKIITIKEMADA